MPRTEAQKNEPHEIQRLIESRIDPSVANGVGQTALHVACLWGNDACVEVLIKAEAEVRLRWGRARQHCALCSQEWRHSSGSHSVHTILTHQARG